MAVTERSSAHPDLRAALSRVAAAIPAVALDPASATPGAVPVARLADRPEVMDAALAATGASHPAVRAAWFIHGHTWRVAAPAIACGLLDGVVPGLAAGNVTLRIDDAGVCRVGLRDPRATDRPLGEALDAHLADVLSHPALATLGERVRWALAGDALAAAALHVGQALAGPAEAVGIASSLLAAPARFAVPLGLIEGVPVSRWRASCCLAHREGHEVCATCPRRRRSATG